MKTYTLTLSDKYAAHWGLWEAVREIIQNAYDQRDKLGSANCRVLEGA